MLALLNVVFQRISTTLCVVKRHAFTSVCVIEEDKSTPVVVVQQWQQSSSDGRPELQGELAFSFGGEAGCHEADVQGPTERRQRVHGALVVKAENGKHPSWILRANCCSDRKEQGEERRGEKKENKRKAIRGQMFKWLRYSTSAAYIIKKHLNAGCISTC